MNTVRSASRPLALSIDDAAQALSLSRDSFERHVMGELRQWAFQRVDDVGRPLYAGIRYLSRLSSEWECWAVFDDVQIEEWNRRPILPQDPALQKIAKVYGLTPY